MCVPVRVVTVLVCVLSAGALCGAAQLRSLRNYSALCVLSPLDLRTAVQLCRARGNHFGFASVLAYVSKAQDSSILSCLAA